MVSLFNKDMGLHSNSNINDIRKNLVNEIEGIMQYEDTIQRINDSPSRRMLEEIRNEELVHVGNLLAMLNYLYPNQRQYIEEGIREFNAILTSNNSNQNTNQIPNPSTPMM